MCFELCPHCEQEVKLPDELGVYKCPECGKWIVNCCQCLYPDCDKFCSYEWKADYFNWRDNNDD